MARTTKVNEDIDEKNEGLSYEKGRQFELEFANFLKYERGWSKVRIGASMQGKFNAKGTTIDILGERLDYTGIKYKDKANRFMLISIVLGLLSGLWWYEGWGQHGLWLLQLSLFSLLIMQGLKILSASKNVQHCWCECKNLKGKVDINHVAKMLREIDDFKATKNEHYKLSHFYFASANGYVENALKMAHDNKIICYVKKGINFEEVKYWNE